MSAIINPDSACFFFFVCTFRSNKFFLERELSSPLHPSLIKEVNCQPHLLEGKWKGFLMARNRISRQFPSERVSELSCFVSNPWLLERGKPSGWAKPLFFLGLFFSPVSWAWKLEYLEWSCAHLGPEFRRAVCYRSLRHNYIVWPNSTPSVVHVLRALACLVIRAWSACFIGSHGGLSDEAEINPVGIEIRIVGCLSAVKLGGNDFRVAASWTAISFR